MTAAAARLLLALLLLGGCGLQPVYSSGAASPAAQSLAGVEILPIGDRAGYLMEQALRKRLRPEGPARYQLSVKLEDSIEGFGIRGDDSIARERRTLRARWQLTDPQTGATLIDQTARADISIDVVQSDYAVLSAEDTALERLTDDIADQITARIALHARTAAGQHAS